MLVRFDQFRDYNRPADQFDQIWRRPSSTVAMDAYRHGNEGNATAALLTAFPCAGDEASARINDCVLRVQAAADQLLQLVDVGLNRVGRRRNSRRAARAAGCPVRGRT